MLWSDTSRAGLTLAALVALLLAGCGFHLQGAGRLPAQVSVVAVVAPDANARFARSLTDALGRAGARVERSPSEEAYAVQILSDESGERVLSVSARGVPEEYELFHTIRYEVRAPDGPGIPATTMTVTRDYRFDETELLSKREEATYLQEAMIDDLVGTIMRRLRLLAQ